MVIQHNLLAANANRQLNINTDKKAKTTEMLSSGYRINRAADDAAGLSISEKMRRQIRGLTQASTNAQDGISLVQVADGAMAEVMEMLQRGNELSVKAAHGTLTDVERGYIQDEIDHIKDEINGISDRTKFNDMHVLKGKDVPVEKAPGGAAIISGLPAWVNLGSTTKMEETYTTTETYQYTDATTTNIVTGTAQINHAAATLDFSAFDGSADKIASLKGQGFYSTCCTCTNHYSIKFTDGTGSSVQKSGDHYVYNIGIDGATDANDLIQRMISGTENGNPNGHYTMLKDTGNGVLTVYDDRKRDPLTIVTPNNEPITWVGWKFANGGSGKPVGDYGRFGRGIAVSEQDVDTENPVNIVLQIGGEADEIMGIDLPSISTKSVGIDDVDVSTQTGAGAGINAFKEAINYVSTERSRMGAY